MILLGHNLHSSYPHYHCFCLPFSDSQKSCRISEDLSVREFPGPDPQEPPASPPSPPSPPAPCSACQSHHNPPHAVPSPTSTPASRL